MTNKAKAKETFGKAVFGIAAVICIIAVIAIFTFLIIKSVPAFNKLGIFDFVFGDNWAPDRNDTFDTESISGSYGIFSMIVGTFAATVGALLFGGVLGYFTAVFIVFFCPRKLKRVFSSVINLLAGIPARCLRIFRHCVLTSVTIQHCTQQRKWITRNLNHTWYYDFTDRCITFQNKY